MKSNIAGGAILLASTALWGAMALSGDARAMRPDGISAMMIPAATAATGDPGQSGAPMAQGQKKPELTPEQKMQSRFPQPVKVGHLIGLPVLDGGDSTIGYVKEVVRDADGNIKLIVPYAKWFGWMRNGHFFVPDRRLVAVPIEVVAILALQIDALDMDRAAFNKAPTWLASEAQALPDDETIKIALGRR